MEQTVSPTCSLGTWHYIAALLLKLPTSAGVMQIKNKHSAMQCNTSRWSDQHQGDSSCCFRARLKSTKRKYSGFKEPVYLSFPHFELAISPPMLVSFTLPLKSVSNKLLSTPLYGKCISRPIQDVFQNKNKTGTTIKKATTTHQKFLPLAEWVYIHIHPTILLPYQAHIRNWEGQESILAGKKF